MAILSQARRFGGKVQRLSRKGVLSSIRRGEAPSTYMIESYGEKIVHALVKTKDTCNR